MTKWSRLAFAAALEMLQRLITLFEAVRNAGRVNCSDGSDRHESRAGPALFESAATSMSLNSPPPDLEPAARWLHSELSG